MIEQIKKALAEATNQGKWIHNGNEFVLESNRRVGIGGFLKDEDNHLVENSAEWLRHLIDELLNKHSEMELIKEELFYEKRAAEENHDKYVAQYHRVEELQKALEWYADKQNYEFYGMGVVINEDKGEIARQTLERSKSQ